MSKLPNREGETVDFKREWTKRALEDIGAFANHRGGVVYVGVDDDGTVVGCAGSDRELQLVANQVTEALGLRPRIEWEQHNAKDVLVIRVEEAGTPVSCRGRYLTRVGSTNREMTGEQLTRLFVEKSGVRWDGLDSEHGLDDVDETAAEQFVERARKKRLPSLKKGQSLDQVLGKIEVLRDGKLSNAGLLLFGKQPQIRYANARVRVGRFENGEVVEDADASGNLWTQLGLALEAVVRFMRVHYKVRSTELSAEGIKRKESWEYPIDAVRELLVNALIHRDYVAMGDIQIRLDENQLRVWSPGGLPDGIEVEDLFEEEHMSVLRNPLLAGAFFYAEDIERWGTGTGRAIRLCKEHGLPRPKFVERQGGFEACLPRFRAIEELVALGLEERAARVVARVEREGGVKNQEVQEMLGVSKRTATRILQDLVAAGFLHREGVGRGVRYVSGKGAK